jgi:hypothetical protein
VFQVVTGDAASVIRGVLSKFLLPGIYLSSSGYYLLDLSGLGDPVGSNAIAGLAIRVTGTHKPLHPNKVEIPSKECNPTHYNKSEHVC